MSDLTDNIDGAFSLVDGQRTVREFKAILRFSPEIVERALIFLIAMQQISIQRRKRTET